MRIKITSGEEFPIWTLAHFAGATEANYSKLLQISRLISRMRSGAHDRQFFVGANSANLYLDPASPQFDRGDMIILAEKGESAADFWARFASLRRPIIFYRAERQGDRAEPLYSSADPDALKILEANVTSPFTITFEGLDKVIHELRFGREEERRRQELHDAEMEKRAVEIKRDQISVVREALSLTEEIEAAPMSEGGKQRIRELADHIANRQDDLTRKISGTITTNPAPKITIRKKTPRLRS